MERHYPQQVNLDDLAAGVGMSLRNFKRRFRKATGDSPLMYLQRYRVDVAKRLLQGTPNPTFAIRMKKGPNSP